MTNFSGIIKKLFFKYLIWLIIVVTGSILIYMITDFSKTIKAISKDRITQSINATETKLDNFFKPVIQQLLITKKWGESNLLQPLKPEKLNPVFTSVLAKYKQISSMLIANNNGCEYMLLEMGNGKWINRKTTIDSVIDFKEVLKYEWDYNTQDSLLIKTEWIEKKDYDPRIRPWFKAAISYNKNGPAWTEPYTFATTKDPGITTSIKWFDKDSLINVVAYDLMLTDISGYTTNLQPSKNGKAFILTSDFKLIGLPAIDKYKNIDTLKQVF